MGGPATPQGTPIPPQSLRLSYIPPHPVQETRGICSHLNPSPFTTTNILVPQILPHGDYSNLPQVDVFREDLCTKEPALNEFNLSNLKAPLDIPVPDPVKEKEKEERKKQQEASQEEKEDKDEKKKGEDEDKGPPCGPVNCNEKIVVLLQRLKPEIKDVIEQLNLVTTWLQLQIPRIEDGNNFGVAVQEKVFELMTSLHTKLEGFHTQISKYFSERGDAVAKAAKQPHVGDYRQLVHELDEAEYRDIRLMVMEIRNAYAVLYDIILKNFEKLKKPRGETKGMIY
ncbi:proteasome activator complex subunit 1 isoform 1 [Camelus ferus]|nr:proteasome activator complex subunit 1 isoform 1 [Camelus ferus]